jgi:hypothetical protein
LETGSIGRLMKVYRVEEVENNTVRMTHVIEAFTPFQAAIKAIGREVTLRRDEPSWIKVTETLTRAKQIRDGRVFEYSVGGYPAHG